MKLSVFFGILCTSFILRHTQAARSCDTSFYVNNFGLKATSETAGNLAADVFTNGWCAGNATSPHIDVDFKQLLGINAITIGSPANQGPNVFPRKVLVQYVPNGGSDFVNFPIGSTGKLEIEFAHAGSLHTAFGGLSILAGKLRFIILAYEGSACLKIDLEGCEATDVCQGGCHNGGLCLWTDHCQCATGFYGSNCEMRAPETTTMVTTTSPILSALTTSLPTTQETLTTSYPHKPITLEDVITVSCTGANWNVTVDMDQLSWLYPFISDKDVFLGQPSCQGESRDNILLLFQQRFDNPNCLTKEKVVNGMKFYENIIHYAILDPKDPTIIRYHEWSFDVGCIVSNSASTSNHFEHTVEVHNETYTVYQDINIAFYKDPNFLNEFKEPIHLTVGHDVYVKVYVEQPDMNFKMRLHTCYTNPPGQDAARLEHVLINDGCEVDSTTHILSQSTQETRFMFQDYQSVAMESGLDVHCNATFCDINDHSRDCLQVCHKSPSIIG